jgi:hypothetical protein
MPLTSFILDAVFPKKVIGSRTFLSLMKLSGIPLLALSLEICVVCETFHKESGGMRFANNGR